MPFSTRRSSTRGTPCGLLGSSGSITRHSKSVRSYRLMPVLSHDLLSKKAGFSVLIRMWCRAVLLVKLPNMRLGIWIIAFAALLAADVSALATTPPALGCFRIRGRVAPDAGHPTFRVSPETGTGLLALSEQDTRGNLIDPLPPNVRRLFPRDQRAVETVFTGDFLICPLEAPRPGNLRLVRMARARNLSVRTGNWVKANR